MKIVASLDHQVVAESFSTKDEILGNWCLRQFMHQWLQLQRMYAERQWKLIYTSDFKAQFCIKLARSRE